MILLPGFDTRVGGKLLHIFTWTGAFMVDPEISVDCDDPIFVFM